MGEAVGPQADGDVGLRPLVRLSTHDSHMKPLHTVLVLIFLVCGCAAISRHPAQIPAFVSGNEQYGVAPKISGSYTNKGEAFTVEGKSLGTVLLSRLLLVDVPRASSWQGGVSNKVSALYGDDPARPAADSVTVLEPEPDVFEMQFSSHGQSVATRRFSKYTSQWTWDSAKLGQPYNAVEGFVNITTREEHGGASGYSGGGGMYQEGEECFLRKAVDGSLIVLHRAQGFGLLLIVPFGGREDFWCRFPALEAGSQTQPSPAK